jgi:hypothetical protein
VTSAGVCVEPAGTFVVCLLLFLAVFHAQKEVGALCTAGGLVGLFVLPFGHCTLVHFGLFSSLNLMMCNSLVRSRKKNHHTSEPGNLVIFFWNVWFSRNILGWEKSKIPPKQSKTSINTEGPIKNKYIEGKQNIHNGVFYNVLSFLCMGRRNIYNGVFPCSPSRGQKLLICAVM